MKKPSPSQWAKTSPSIASVLKVISEERSLVIFNDIVLSGNDNDRFISLKEINLSSRLYHSRLSSFLETGLIKRHKSRYVPTLLGRVVYDSLMIIEEALSQYWKLKVIDQIEMSDFDLPTDEAMTQLINALIDNHRIKYVLLKYVDVDCVEAKSDAIS